MGCGRARLSYGPAVLRLILFVFIRKIQYNASCTTHIQRHKRGRQQWVLGSRASQPLSHVCAELPGPEEEGQVNPHILVAAWLLDPRAGAVTDATMYPRERGRSDLFCIRSIAYSKYVEPTVLPVAYGRYSMLSCLIHEQERTSRWAAEY